jgi:hypothetical protein
MNTTSKSELFTLANKIRKENKCSQKEAFALAKEQLNNNTTMDLHNMLVALMMVKNVKFTYKNTKGQNITTTGTLLTSHIPTNRKIQGRKTAKDDNFQVFYDVRHGVYRSYKKTEVVKIF